MASKKKNRMPFGGSKPSNAPKTKSEIVEELKQQFESGMRTLSK